MTDDAKVRPPDLPAAPGEPTSAGDRAPRVVGIGASAGGLQAFTDFVHAMPPDSGFAFVLIQHLDPQQPSMLAELLASHTSMPVLPAVDGTTVAPNHIYLIPPNTALTLVQGALRLEPPTEAHGHRLPIDYFFHSLAADQGPRAIGIVLSGSGADGSQGLAAIRAAGGLTIAQTPASAQFASMPQEAIRRGAIDEILDVAAMPARLLAATRPGPAPDDAPDGAADPDIEPLRTITTILRQATGHDFSHYKSSTLMRRIERRMQLLRLSDQEAYSARLQQDRAEVELLFQDLLISVTDFFRDPAAFAALGSGVIASLVRSKDARTPLRVWVPGCATGEEAYSIAILLYEQMAQLDTPPPVQLFATDIDESALAVARRGLYDASIVAQLSAERLAQFFVRDGQGYRIGKAIRELCLFSAHNLISDPPFGRMDLISCRNLMIYFDAELQRQLIPVLHYALAPGGYLFLGSAESVKNSDTGDLFRAVDSAQRIYQRKDRVGHSRAAMPWTAITQEAARRGSAARRPAPAESPDIGTTLNRILLRDHAPPAAVIDERGTVIYLTGRSHPYLSVPAGTPTANILAMAHPELQLPLRAAMRAATQGKMPIVREDLTITVADSLQRLSLSVQPFVEPGIDAGLLLVVIQPIGAPTPLTQAARRSTDAGEPADNLALELQRTRTTLEATIGEVQSTNSELTAANEEQRSLNEELQAANEELQTSQEEIQSINEELQTVNAELSRKIEELDRANADLSNLFASTQIPAIFLHIDGRIARFTPQATELFALIDSDIGRPISDLSARFSADDLPAQIARVIRTLTSLETAVHQPERDKWWSLHIRPYRTHTNMIDGVVLTFADITTLKRADAVLRQSHDDLELLVAERTRDLAVANTALLAQVAERGRSEQAREQLLQQLVTAQEEERRRIARELHDQLSQDLTALILGLKSLQDNSTAAERIVQLQAMAVQISEEVRRLAVQLRPMVLDDLGLPLALSNYIEQWSARAHVAGDLHTSGLDEQRLPLAVEAALYRLVQEALSNVLKHAGASEVSVIIERYPEEVRLIIEDDGVGFVVPAAEGDLASRSQLGVIGMRERVALLNGSLTIESAPGSGTTIFARIPLPAGA